MSHQLPDSPSSTSHHEKWLPLPLPLLDTFRPRVTVKRRGDDPLASFAAASLTMEQLLNNYGKPFSDEEISTTFQDILGSDPGTSSLTGLNGLTGLSGLSGLGLAGVTSFSAIPKGFPNFTPVPPPPGPDEMLMCMKCKRDGSHRPLIECNDCHKRYHLNCHRPAVTDVELDPRLTWLCAECSLAKKIAAPLPKTGAKESLKMTFCKYTSGVPLKNEKEMWRTRREPLKSPEELFPSLMSAAAAIEPIAFQRKGTDPIRVDRRRLTANGQPAGLAAWAAKVKAAKIAKKSKAKAPETIVRAEEDSSEIPDSTVEPTTEENEVKVTKVVIRRKRLDKRLEDLLAEARHLLGDSVSLHEGRRTRSQTSFCPIVKVEPMEVEDNYNNDDEEMEMPQLESALTLPDFIPDVPGKRNRISSRGRTVKKQLKLTINLTEEKVSFEEKDEEPKMKKARKAKKKSGKRSSRRKNKERVSSTPSYMDKSSDEEDFEQPQNVMRIPGLTLLSE